MKILTWNVNSIKTLQYWSEIKNFTDILAQLDADIICFQEIKGTRKDLSEEFHTIRDWFAFYSLYSSGYSGVGTFVRRKYCPRHCEIGFTGLLSSFNLGCLEELYAAFTKQELIEMDKEARCVITDHDEFILFNVYYPATSESIERNDFKLRFSKAVQIRFKALQNSGRKVILVGDINVAHLEIDRWDRDDTAMEFDAHPVRAWFASFLHDSGLVDTFRHFYPNQKHIYTVWNIKEFRRQTNQGSRIDYILVPASMVSYLKDCLILSDIAGSDHVPVICEIDETKFEVSIELSLKVPPKGCTFHWSNYGERQRSINAFLVKEKAGSFNAHDQKYLSDRVRPSKIIATVTSKVVKKTPNKKVSTARQSTLQFFKKD